ncbi:MAG: DUF4253 domain-containing protein [Akkermansiaceae bacterium]|nr:DUF4253 domain-containing protein [Akkermansiaceae bacterium]MCF7730295.1 DUF4253 domain-containing protein [Akkermansiaceae bacterium]
MKVIEVPGDKAMQELTRLLAKKADTGLHPVWFGGNRDITFIAEGRSQVKNPKTSITRSMKMNIDEMIADFYSPDSNDGEPREEEPAEEAWVLEEETGEDSEVTDGDDELDLYCSGKPPHTVHIGLLDIDEPWQMFAHLGWGGSDSDFQCALHRRWQEEWGAEVVVLQESIIECRVLRPPQTRKDAMRLAREQYFYCGDIVSQGTGSVLELAYTLLGLNQWFFWWD